MKDKTVDLTGKKFSNLLVLEKTKKSGYELWNCLCDCGNTRYVKTVGLTSGCIKSCGCQYENKSTKHGKCYSSVYNVWRSMRSRCNNPNNHAYHLYGGRGISVCEGWENFE